MKKYIILAAAFLSTTVFAQKEDLVVFAGVNFQKVSDENLIGGDLNVRYYLGNDFSLGGGLAYVSKRFSDGFGYLTDRTVLRGMSINALIQYDFLKNQRFMFAGFLSNGIQLVGLRNLNDVETYEYYDDYGNPYDVDVAKILHKDVFYQITPGIDLSFKMVQLNEAEQLGLYLTSRTGYQMTIGKNTMTSNSYSSNLVWSVGVTIKGTTKSLEE